jgi:L-iditol 2-dehydrogenase
MGEALFLHGIRDARIGTHQPRAVQADDILIEVASVGICGSDLHYYKDGRIGSGQVIKDPFVPGHEFAGFICDDCEELGLKRGALVAVDPNKACGACPWCVAGHSNLCPKVEFIGAPPFHGAMTQSITVPRAQIVPLPSAFTPLQAVMTEPLGIAIHAVDLAKPRLLEQVTILGCGPIGLLILQVLKIAGAGEIIMVDPQAHRRKTASALGASKVAAGVLEVLEFTGGIGSPLVLEATNAPEGFSDAVTATRIGGRIVLVGIPDGDVYTLSAAEARRRALSIKFSRRMGHVYPRAIDLVSQGRVDVAAIVSHIIALEDAPATFAALADNADGFLKVLIDPRIAKA